MTDAAFLFIDKDRIGRVASVDTSRVAIDVTNSVLLTRIGIGQLVAIRGTTEREYLIAMTERVTRTVREELPNLEDGDNDMILATVPTDLIQAILIGTFRTIEGAQANTFKRGADSFPQIDRDCFIIEGSDQNAPNQASRFTLHVRNLKGETLDAEDKNTVKKTFTVDSPIPYDIKKLVTLLDTDNTTKGVGKTGPVKGEWEDKLTRFLSRLEAKLDDRRYGFMFSPPGSALKYDWLGIQVLKLLESKNGTGIKVIDFSEVPADVLPIVTGTLARLLYDVQFWMYGNARTPVNLLCDEAHLYLPIRDDADAVQRQALGAFERIAKEGRKYGFSLLVVSQRPSDISRTILSQCNNFLALRLTNETDQGVIKRLMPDSLAGLTSILPLLDTGEALLLGDAVLLPTRIRLDVPKITPNSATRDFWRQWGTEQPQDSAILSAVESLRSQSRI